MIGRLRAWADDAVGGPIPLLVVERQIYAQDGTSYSLDLTWWRRGLRLEYHTPRFPPRVRRARAAEAARLEAHVQKILREGGHAGPAGRR